MVGKYVSLALVVVVGIILQVVFALTDCRVTPSRVAVNFTKAYFGVDEGMAGLMCEDRKTVDDTDVVDQYIYQQTREAKQRGVGVDYVKSIVYGIETHTHFVDGNTAEVRITGKRRTAINPVYFWVAGIFRIGETYALEETIKVVKEEGAWKVCGKLFSLPEAVSEDASEEEEEA